MVSHVLQLLGHRPVAQAFTLCRRWTAHGKPKQSAGGQRGCCRCQITSLPGGAPLRQGSLQPAPGWISCWLPHSHAWRPCTSRCSCQMHADGCCVLMSGKDPSLSGSELKGKV